MPGIKQAYRDRRRIPLKTRLTHHRPKEVNKHYLNILHEKGTGESYSDAAVSHDDDDCDEQFNDY